jgi:hypothetical protein
MKSFFRYPARIAWTAAIIVLCQAALHVWFSPYDPQLGEGNIDRLNAAINLWVSVFVAIVLVSLGFYLRSRRKEDHAA